MGIYESAQELIGNTPLVRLSRYCAQAGVGATLLAKLEQRNPAGSAKDRIGKAMLDDAERKGLLKEGATVIEPTSGNTGIALASICAQRGYRLILTMPETMSVERRKLLAAYGAQIVLTEGKKGMQGAVDRAQELHAQIEGSFIPGQFVNPVNPAIHRATTGEEIWRDCDGNVDIFVAGIGTGGTISGVGQCLKAHNPRVQVVAVEPAGSPLLSEGRTGSHGLQGIGANFVPETLDRSVIDRIVTVKEPDAYDAARLLARNEGILSGISAGAALWAATQLLKEPDNRGKNVVVLLPDTGDRYLSTALFAD